MPLYKFTDSKERDYALEDGNVHAEPGECYELATDPGDGRWEFIPDSAKGTTTKLASADSTKVEAPEVTQAAPVVDSEPEVPSGDALDSTDAENAPEAL